MYSFCLHQKHLAYMFYIHLYGLSLHAADLFRCIQQLFVDTLQINDVNIERVEATNFLGAVILIRPKLE